MSNLGRFLLMFIYTFLFVILVVALSNHAISWLVFLTVCSYVKLFITLIKYVPQVSEILNTKTLISFNAKFT